MAIPGLPTREEMKPQAIFRALPIAALCACHVAFAAEPTSPNSYTFSGTLDMGVYRDFDGSNNVGPISRSSITLAGARDLGNGNAATFNLTARLDPSTGEVNDPGSAKKPFFHGEATVGLKNDRLGSIRLGRALDVIEQNNWAYDPFYNYDSIASAAWNTFYYRYATDRTSNTKKADGTPTGEYARLNNGVFYDSPVVNGFQGHISGSFEKSPEAIVGGVDAAGQGNNLGAAVTYNLGPVSMMLGHTKNTSGDTRTQLGGKYTIDTLELMAAVNRETEFGRTELPTVTTKTVGVSYGMGKYRYMANVGVLDDAQSMRFVGLGATYAIDDMTNVYASVGNKRYKTASSQSAYGVGINYRF
jgi:predicted porin